MRAEEYQAEVMRALHQCRETIRQQMDAYNRNASRKAVKSLEVRPDPAGATLWGVKYFDTMQHGRPAGPVRLCSPLRVQHAWLCRRYCQDRGLA